MGFVLSSADWESVVQRLRRDYIVFAPILRKGAGRATDTDCVIYGEATRAADIELDHKSDYAFKEALLPFSETLFFFNQAHTTTADLPDPRPYLVFLRSCDLQALKRLDQIYLENGPSPDFFYARRRERVRFVLIGCPKSFENCFCVSMGTNRSDEGYAFSIDRGTDGAYRFNVVDSDFMDAFKSVPHREEAISPAYVTENQTKVHIPEQVPQEVYKDSLWDEYSRRCIGCGRCNFVCPTCTCFSMQDLYYDENSDAGERRRVAASCMVDGFTTVAGGGEYRKTKGERMRFKTLHKIFDHRQRFGVNMCVGCGRCDDICPEYISFTNVIKKVDALAARVESTGKAGE